MLGGAAVVGAVFVASCDSSSAPASPESSSHDVWPDEPAGLARLTDRTWTELDGGGWQRRDSSADRIVDDATVPAAPPTALEYTYAEGFPGGTAPATHYYALGGKKELFVGLLWKVSSPWQGHASQVNKIQFAYTGSSDVAMVMYGPNGGPYELRVMPQWPEHNNVWLTPNVENVPPALDHWHRVEWYLKYESTYGAGDGVIRWWMDGTLVGDYSALKFPRDSGFTEYQISPTWGGVGDVKTETDYYRFQRSYISSR